MIISSELINTKEQTKENIIELRRYDVIELINTKEQTKENIIELRRYDVIELINTKEQTKENIIELRRYDVIEPPPDTLLPDSNNSHKMAGRKTVLWVPMGVKRTHATLRH